jgi:hypothetical protein
MTPHCQGRALWVLHHFPVRLSLYVIPKRASRESEGFPRLLTPFKGERGWLNISGPPKYTLIEWTIGGRMHQKSSATKVTHLSTIYALSYSTLEFP